MQLTRPHTDVVTRADLYIKAALSILLLSFVVLISVSHFSSAGYRFVRHNTKIFQTQLKVLAKAPTVLESVTPLVGKNEFILPDLPAGVARNIPSWDQLIGLRSAIHSGGKASRIAANDEKHKEPKPKSSESTPNHADVSHTEPENERQSKIRNNPHLDPSVYSLLSNLLANYGAHKSTDSRASLKNCFELDLSRQDIERCVQIQYSLASRELRLENRDLEDKLHLRRLEIRALTKEISNAAEQLRSMSISDSQRHRRFDLTNPTSHDVNQHDLWQDDISWKESSSNTENPHIEKDHLRGESGKAAKKISTFLNLLQNMVQVKSHSAEKSIRIVTKETPPIDAKEYPASEHRTAAMQMMIGKDGRKKPGIQGVPPIFKLSNESKKSGRALLPNQAARRVAQAMSAVAEAKRLQLFPSVLDTGPVLPQLPPLSP